MKRKLLCLILAICCMASMLCGCSNFSLNGLSGLLNLFGGGNKAATDTVAETVTARVNFDNTPLWRDVAVTGEPETYLFFDTEFIPDGIAIFGDTIWVSGSASGYTGWIELEYLSFSYTDRVGTLPVRAGNDGAQIYFHPNTEKQQKTEPNKWLSVANICFYDNQYWGYVNSVGYIRLDDVTIPETFKYPEFKIVTPTDTSLNLYGLWYREVPVIYEDAQAVEETWLFNPDGTFLVLSNIYTDSLTKPDIWSYQGGLWRQDGDQIELIYTEVTSDGVILGNNRTGEGGFFIIIPGQEGPVLCGGGRFAFSPFQKYGKPDESLVPEQKPEEEKPVEQKPQENNGSTLTNDFLAGTWRAVNSSYGASAAIHLAMNDQNDAILTYSYGYGMDDLYTPSNFDTPYFCTYKISSSTLTFTSIGAITNDGLDETAKITFSFDIIEKKDKTFTLRDNLGNEWWFRRVTDYFNDMETLHDAVNGNI